MPLTRLRSSGLAANLTLGNVTVSGTLSNNTGSEFVTAATASAGPKITNIQVVDSSYTVLDDTAVDIAGGNIKLTGSGFNSGCQVIIGSTPASATTFVSSTEVIAQLPATVAGTYIVYLANTDGSVAIRVNGVTFSATPTWTTASTLEGQAVDTPISIQLSANSATTYSLAVGSTLPAGLTLSNVGLLSGTVTGLSNDTTYSFTVVATDAELQDSPRTFSVTITAGDPYGMNTVLLLQAENTGLAFNSDSSTNAFNLSLNGDVRPNNFNPYTPGYYSNYFDGTGDWLTLPANSGTAPGNNDFTLEAWVNLSALKDYQVIYDNRASGGSATGLAFGVDSAGKTYLYTNNGFSIVSSIAMTVNNWNHVALVRSGNTITIYVNGNSSGTFTSTANFSDTNTGIGIALTYTPTSQFFGYISNFRILKGTALYTSNFTPSTTPLTAISGTSLLTCQSNRFIDTSSNNFAITANGNTSISGFVPFAPDASYKTYGSGYFDGSGDYLAPATNSAFAFDTGDLTFECWIYATTANDSPIYESRSTNSTTDGFTVTAFSSTVIRVYTTSVLVSATVSNYLNTWTHVAFTRQGSTNRLFINGVLGATATAADNFSNTVAFIGAGRYTSASVSAYFTGYISNFQVVKGTALYTADFTPPTAPLTAVANTSLLTLQTNQGVNNNQFLDNSTNNFLITRNGNTTQGSFSPYGSRWSNYFDGTGDYLSTVSDAAFAFGTGDFTIEAWVYPTTIRNGENLIYVTEVSGGLSFGFSQTGIYIGARAVAYDLSVSYAMSANTWTHVSVARENGTARFFANGILVGSGSATRSYLQGSGAVGDYPGANGNGVTGYLSNVRVVKGTALYTSNFTPAIAPLTAVSGTSLLTCQSNRFIDNSTNNFAITRVGDTRVTKFSPFKLTEQYSPEVYGGSAYFDGTDDDLSLPSSVAFAFGTGDFTVEGWVYITATSNPIGFFRNGSDNLNLQRNSSGNLEAWDGSTFSSSSPVYTNTWNHIMWTRSSGIARIYLNGTQVLTWSQGVNYTATTFRIGATGGSYQNKMFGYISNLRIVQGTALHTSNFTPPTAPVAAVANTSLLLNFTNAGIVDNSTNNTLGTVGTTRISTAVKKYGTGSMYFDGTGDSLLAPTNPVMSLGSTDFTVEVWIYPTINAVQGIISFGNGSTTQPYFYLNGLTPTFLWNGVNVAAGPALTLNTWSHIAVTRNISTVRVFTNGISGTAASPYTDTFTTSGIYVGSSNSSTQYFTGYIDDLRITKGIARYTANFTPPGPLSMK